MAKKKTVTVNGEDWTLERVRELIETSPDARLKALMVIYSYQTEHEKGCGRNSEYNGVGFNKVDVERYDAVHALLHHLRLHNGLYEMDSFRRLVLTNTDWLRAST